MIKRKYHGQTKDGKVPRHYRRWASIKSRCNNPNDFSFRYYGAKDIKMCSEWESDFVAFQTWCDENGFKEGLTIDRIKSDQGYNPENCRFVTQRENSRLRDYVRINPELAGEIRTIYAAGKLSQSKIGEKYGVAQQTISVLIAHETW